MIEAAWLRIERALEAIEQPVNPLPGAAAKADLAALTAALPVPLPEELEASLRCHDGTGSVGLDELPSLLSAAQILTEHTRLAAGVEGPHGTVTFEPSWVPFQAYGGVWICAAPRGDGRAGHRLLGLSVEEPAPFEVEGTYGLRLEDAADAVERLAPPAPAESGPAPWALRVISELVRAGELELESDARPEALAERLERAAVGLAAMKSPRALAEAILDALVDAPEVDEVYADRKAILLALDV